MKHRKSIQDDERFGYLTTIALVRKNPYKWLCQCDCGFHVVVDRSNLTSGHTKSCGCARGTHRQSDRVEYRTWIAVKSRCYWHEGEEYHLYGGRGISVCDRWLYGEDGKSGFECFFEDMGPRPSDSHSIDRIDVNGNYSPDNCRWASAKTQGRNTRRNHYVDVGGKRVTLADAVDESGLKYNTVLYRLKRGWSVEDALKRPRQKGVRP